MSADGETCQVAIINPNFSGSGTLDWVVGRYEGFAELADYEFGSFAVDWSAEPTFIFRLESFASGRQVFSISGVVTADFIPANHATGPYVGLLMRRTADQPAGSIR